MVLPAQSLPCSLPSTVRDHNKNAADNAGDVWSLQEVNASIQEVPKLARNFLNHSSASREN
ncbi:hypothetical protein U9M48_004994 [Paspalum notatum var. saurae]|uniref:Uncharacterized protein n=1 Tax=Paspalum notatum var. saurae TaxID=547442 RepID=A0AAQ3PR70_PASNO